MSVANRGTGGGRLRSTSRHRFRAISSYFSPDALRGLVLWLEARSGDCLDVNLDPCADTDPVRRWVSRDDGAHQFEQGTAAARPLYTASAVNGRPGVTFDGVDDLLVKATAFLTSSAGTVFAVVNATAQGHGRILSSGDEAADLNYVTFGVAPTATYSEAAVVGDTDWVYGSVDAVGQAMILTFSSDGSTWAINTDGNPNTANIGSGSNTGDWFGDQSGLDNVAVGADKKNSTEENFLTGTICEIIVYDRDLSIGEKQRVRTYLGHADKYGIGVTL